MRVILLLLSVMFSAGAVADQCQVVEVEQAEAFVKMVKRGDMLGSLCEPCGEAPTELGGPTFAEIQRIAIRPWSDQPGMAEVLINGQPIDLAYTFVKTLESERYSVVVNAAYLVACEARGVTNRFVIGD